MNTRHLLSAGYVLNIAPTHGAVAVDVPEEGVNTNIESATAYGPYRFEREIVIGGKADLSEAEAGTGPDTGWEDIVDGQYTSGSPFQPSTSSWTAIDFDSITRRNSQVPADVGSFFDDATSTITGRNGDGISITLEFTAKPTTATVTYLDVAFDIGGGIGRIYPRTITFPKGQNQERIVSFNVDGYTLDTWEQNGAAIVFNPNAAIDIFGCRVVVTRTHRAR